MGPYHTAVITSSISLTLASGQLYTFGSGKNGALGNSSENDHYEPVEVTQFNRYRVYYSRVKVVDVQCGEQYTVAKTGNNCF